MVRATPISIFSIPETISGLEVRKGPYWADVGDFDNAGALNISLRDSIGQNIQSVTAGSFGYTRLLSYGSVKVGGGSLLYAGEFNTENGPWDTAEDLRKFSGLLRYSQGTATDGFSATAMAYANSWNSSDQIALRAITTGQVGLFGEIDPTDGGDTSRFMLSTRFAHSDDNGMWKANAYVVKYTLNLFNNFTWFTTNPTLGDQFHQSDDRIYSGGAVSRTFNGTLFSWPSQTVVGLQTRDDDINVGLTNTFRRQFLSNTLFDHVNEGNVGVYAENTTRWTDWWRTTLGLRGDYFAASVNSMLQPANSGNPNAVIPSPKFTSVFGPFYKTEFFLGAGLGYHSNDARGVVTSQVPGDPSTPQSGTPFLVRSAGAEVGARTKIVPGLDSSISLFALRQDSELFFDGDTGTTVPGPPSLRTGIEITNNYQPVSWMRFDADLALSRARFIGPDTAQQELFDSLTGFPQAQIGNAPGNFIPEAPWMVASAGITLGERTGWFSTLRWRYISSRPLTEDGVFQSPPVNTINGRVGYQFANGWRIQLDALNLLNSSSYNASYAYGALLPSDALFAKCFPASGAPTVPAAVCQNGFMDYSIHPLDPTAVRLTLAGPIDSIDIPKMAKEFKRALPTYQPPAPNYDWTGFYVGAYVDNTWSKTSASHGRQCERWKLRLQHRCVAVGRWRSARLRLHAAVAPRAWRRGRYVVRRHQDDDDLGPLRHQRQPDDGIRQRNDTRTVRICRRQRLVLCDGRLCLVQRSVRPHAIDRRAQQRDRRHRRGRQQRAYGMDRGRRYCLRLRAELERVCRISLHKLRIIELLASVLAVDDNDDDDSEYGRIGCELQVHFGWAVHRRATGAYPAGAPSPALVYKSPPARYAYDWSGIYLGGDGGFGWETAKGTLTDAMGAPLTSYSYRVNGPVAGLFVGGNYQLNRVVLGVEGDWQWSNLIGNNQILAPLGAAGAFPAGPFTISTTVKDYASVRGRLGFAFDRFLAFGTAGWAWGNPLTSLMRSSAQRHSSIRAEGPRVGPRVLASITPSPKASLRASNIATPILPLRAS